MPLLACGRCIISLALHMLLYGTCRDSATWVCKRDEHAQKAPVFLFGKLSLFQTPSDVCSRSVAFQGEVPLTMGQEVLVVQVYKGEVL